MIYDIWITIGKKRKNIKKRKIRICFTECSCQRIKPCLHLFPYNWQKMKRREKFGDYLMDISKYIVTGFVLTAFFDKFSEYRWLIYLVGLVFSAGLAGIGLYYNKNS